MNLGGIYMFQLFKNKKDFRRSNLWMQALQQREDKKKALLQPQIQEVIQEPMHEMQSVVAVEFPRVVVTKEDLSASQEQKQLKVLQAELADLPGTFGLASA